MNTTNTPQITGMYKVTNISLDLRNFRHKTVSNENQALRELLSNEKKHKVLELAKDIVALGSLDPSSKLIITADQSHAGQYVVLEGNRRITAIKTLLNPQIAEGLPVANEFRKLGKEFIKNPILDVECVEMDAEEAKIWIRRKHYKAMGGASTVDWDAIARARSDADEGRPSKWLSAIGLLQEKGFDVAYILDGLDEKSTTAERVLESRHIKDLLGIEFSKDGKVKFDNGNVDNGCSLLISLFEEMITPDFKEPVVSSSEQRKEFIEKFSHQSVRSNAPEGEAKESPWSTTKPIAHTSAPTKQSLPRKKTRSKLADKGLTIDHIHLNNLYVELTRLPVETYTHSAAAMIRVFLEKSSMVFIKQERIPFPDKTGSMKWTSPGVKLRDKVKAVLENIDKEKAKPLLSYARDIANGARDRLHSVDLLNEYIHDDESLPAPSELVTIWDRLHPYFLEMFEVLNKKPKP